MIVTFTSNLPVSTELKSIHVTFCEPLSEKENNSSPTDVFLRPASLILFNFLQLSKLPPVAETVKSLEQSNIKYSVFDDVRIEPTDTRLIKAYS